MAEKTSLHKKDNYECIEVKVCLADLDKLTNDQFLLKSSPTQGYPTLMLQMKPSRFKHTHTHTARSLFVNLCVCVCVCA